MTWQDELIELETRLASGALSAEEYRRARDELLAQSQSSPPSTPEQPPQPEQSGHQQAPPQQPPQQPSPQQGSAEQRPSQAQQYPPAAQQPDTPRPHGEPGGPFPPPFQWNQQQPTQQPPQQPAQPPQPTQQGTPPPQQQGLDSTQVIRGVGEDGGERTQVVRPSDPDRTQAVSDPDRTQTVSGVNRPRPSHGRDRLGAGQSTTPIWGRRADPAPSDDETPWAEAPVVAPTSTWMKQGPESFEAEPAKRGKMVGVAVAGVLVLALVVVAVIYFSNTGTSTDDRATPQNPPPQQTTETTRTTTTQPLPAPPPPSVKPKSNKAALVKPPGKARGGGGVLRAGELTERQLFAPTVVDALIKAEFTRGTLKATGSQGVTIGLYALNVQNQQSAKEVAQAYTDDQINGGIPPTDEGAQQGVRVFANDESDGEHFRRAVYVLYDRVVILDVSGEEAEDVREVFGPLLDEQVEFQPPTVRDPQ